mmetsp:Transcript_20056/g.58225  ORF Transcript_20056/g.58225 Transcript_20056/m.58225 type:complete len:235 (-) Transcript_20056:97-801(-)
MCSLSRCCSCAFAPSVTCAGSRLQRIPRSCSREVTPSNCAQRMAAAALTTSFSSAQSTGPRRCEARACWKVRAACTGSPATRASPRRRKRRRKWSVAARPVPSRSASQLALSSATAVCPGSSRGSSTPSVTWKKAKSLQRLMPTLEPTCTARPLRVVVACTKSRCELRSTRCTTTPTTSLGWPSARPASTAQLQPPRARRHLPARPTASRVTVSPEARPAEASATAASVLRRAP